MESWQRKENFPNTMMLCFGFSFCVGNNAPGLQLIKDTNRLWSIHEKNKKEKNYLCKHWVEYHVTPY